MPNELRWWMCVAAVLGLGGCGLEVLDPNAIDPSLADEAGLQCDPRAIDRLSTEEMTRLHPHFSDLAERTAIMGRAELVPTSHGLLMTVNRQRPDARGPAFGYQLFDIASFESKGPYVELMSGRDSARGGDGDAVYGTGTAVAIEGGAGILASVFDTEAHIPDAVGPLADAPALDAKTCRFLNVERLGEPGSADWVAGFLNDEFEVHDLEDCSGASMAWRGNKVVIAGFGYEGQLVFGQIEKGGVLDEGYWSSYFEKTASIPDVDVRGGATVIYSETANRYIVAYSAKRPNDSSDVQVAVFREDDGSLEGDPIQISEVGGFSRDAKLLPTADGILAVWMETGSDDLDGLYVRKLTHKGEIAGDIVRLIEDIAPGADVAFDGVNVGVAWTSRELGGAFFAQYNLEGQQVWKEVLEPPAAGQRIDPSLTWTGHVFAAAWSPTPAEAIEVARICPAAGLNTPVIEDPDPAPPGDTFRPARPGDDDNPAPTDDGTEDDDTGGGANDDPNEDPQDDPEPGVEV